MRETLQDVVAAELPPAFVSSLYPLLNRIYSEAAAFTQEHPLLGEPEQKNLLPYVRRNMVETALRRHALDHGLNATVEWTETHSCQFTAIRTPRVLLTISKTANEWAIPDSCYFRKQNSSVNSMLMQGSLFEVSAQTNKDKELLNAIITHGPAFGSNDLGFMRIGFPRPDMQAWAEPTVSLLDIQERQEKMTKPVDLHAEQEEAQRTPALKKGIEKQADDEEGSEQNDEGGSA